MSTNDFSNAYALIVGIGSDLPITIQDARAFRDVLIDQKRAGYLPDQVNLLTEAAADRHGILAAFDCLIEKVNNHPNVATVIIYFSGHGIRALYPDSTSEYFLVPYDYDPNHHAATSISGREFTERIESMSAKKLVVVLDCCHAGGVPMVKFGGANLVKSPVPQEMSKIMDEGSGLVVIASSREGEYSYVGTAYSVFTECFLDALSGKGSRQSDGFAYILDVLAYLFDQVPKRARGPQHPFVNKILGLGDNFPLCFYAGGDKRVPSDESFSEWPTTSLTNVKWRSVKLRLDALQAEYDIRANKIMQLRSAYAREAGASVRFQLEQEILVEEAQLCQIYHKINELEKRYNKYGK